jgi:hypothetical protein
MRHARHLAYAVGGVGVGVLSLSVAHCTESIGLLTGSHWALSGMLAVGIDAGMVVSELAELASHGTRAERRVRPWALAYTLVAVILSVLLNAYAFGLHAAPGMVWAAWLLGACIPCLVYALGRDLRTVPRGDDHRSLRPYGHGEESGDAPARAKEILRDDNKNWP